MTWLTAGASSTLARRSLYLGPWLLPFPATALAVVNAALPRAAFC